MNRKVVILLHDKTYISLNDVTKVTKDRDCMAPCLFIQFLSYRLLFFQTAIQLICRLKAVQSDEMEENVKKLGLKYFHENIHLIKINHH